MVGNWQHGVLKAFGVRDHEVAVTDIIDFTPWYRRIIVSAPEFLTSAHTYPSAWVRLWVPSLTMNMQVQRGYTLVDPDPETGTVGLDVVLHEPDGPATAWARSVTVGSKITISYTPQRFRLDTGAERILLVGDSTAIPAINSIIGSLPEPSRATAIIEVNHDDVSEVPQHHPGLIRWVKRTSDGCGALDALAELDELDPDSTYLWGAGERRLVKVLREYARTTLSLPRERHHLQNYWI